MTMTAETHRIGLRRLAELGPAMRGLTTTAAGLADAAAARTLVTFDSPSLDSALPEGGLRRGAVHEILGPGRDRRGDGAAAAFAAVLLGRLMQTDPARRPAVWCSNRRVALRQADLAGRPYPLGLAGFGVAVDRLLFVESASDGEALWATEETARSAAAAVLVVELGRLPAVAARRLQLAAEASNTAVLALRSASDGVGQRRRMPLAPGSAQVPRVLGYPGRRGPCVLAVALAKRPVAFGALAGRAPRNARRAPSAGAAYGPVIFLVR